MKTCWRQFETRKDKLESIASKSEGMRPDQMALAWDQLMTKMIELSSPEAPRIPKFNDILLAVVSAQARAKRLDPKPWPKSYDELTFKTATHLCGDSL